MISNLWIVLGRALPIDTHQWELGECPSLRNLQRGRERERQVSCVLLQHLVAFVLSTHKFRIRHSFQTAACDGST
jgi:hypothetical protein